MARRLPVIQSEAPDDAEAATRPPGHWVFIGAGLTAAIWAPIALIVMPTASRLAARVLGVAPSDLASGARKLSSREGMIAAAVFGVALVLSFCVASFLSGALVGRFGGRAGPRQAALGSVTAALGVSLLGLHTGLGLGASLAGIAVVFAVLSLFGAAGGALGGSWGTRLRPSAVLDSGPR